jgi:uncharacterized protein YegL
LQPCKDFCFVELIEKFDGTKIIIMKEKKTIYHYVIDKSGSMAGMENEVILGFNEQLNTLKNLRMELPSQEFIVSLTFFDDVIQNVISFGEVIELIPLNRVIYRPNGTTALLDAIGKSISDIKERYSRNLEDGSATVVMVILTDGHENASRYYTYHSIASLIKDLEKTGNWTFNFMGADLDAIHTSKMLNIRKENTVSFDKSDYQSVMCRMSDSMRNYEHSKSAGFTNSSLFDKFDKKDLRKNK